jgi:glycosyltransferase involved in cell wall biosynthesis
VVTIVMPAFNEADIIETSVREWYEQVVAAVTGANLIVVDDCSTDGTTDVLRGLVRELPRLQVGRPQQNSGHGKALRLGFRLADRPWVFQTDSDRQHDPADFWRLWELREDYDFVFGVRERRADGGFRLFITGMMRLVNFVIWGTWIRDANCPFKLMRRSALEAVLAQIPEDAFIPMVMVSILARRSGYRVAEAAVRHLPRQGGQQSLKGLLRWVRVAAICSLQLVRLRLSARSARRGAPAGRSG